MKRFLLLLTLCATLTGWAQEYEPYLSEEEVTNSVSLLPPPPAEGSVAFLLDKMAYWEYFQYRTTWPERARQAIQDADMSDGVLRNFADAFGLTVTRESFPETYELLMRSKECFGSSGCNQAKRFYQRKRPFVYFESPSLVPEDEGWMRNNYSYPSGHSANFYGLSLIMIDLRPERREALQERAREGGISRLIVGVHWASDVEAGRVVAASVYERLKQDPEFQQQFLKAQQELAAIR